MKILYLFLILTLFSCEVFAEEMGDANLGIIHQLVAQDPKDNKNEESSKINLTNHLTYDVSLNDEYQSTNRKDEFKDTRSKARLNSTFVFAKNLSLNGGFRFSRSNQASENSRRDALPKGGGDRTFENEGLFVEELNFVYDGKKHAFVFGKFNLNFGTAWRFNRGIWTYNIAENYRQREKLGINGIYRVGNAKTVGNYEFSYAIFTNDRKNLDNSTITKRDSAHKYDAVPGDTRSLQSYIGSVDIDFDFLEKEKLSYHFSFMNLAVNNRASQVSPSKIADQKAWVAGMNYKYPLNKNLLLDGILEYADIKNFNGNSDAKQNYLTGNVIAKIYNNWNITLGYARERQSVIANDGYNKNLTEISAGYTFRNSNFFDKFLFQMGYKNQRDNYKTSIESRNSLGFLVRYQKEF